MSVSSLSKRSSGQDGGRHPNLPGKHTSCNTSRALTQTGRSRLKNCPCRRTLCNGLVSMNFWSLFCTRAPVCQSVCGGAPQREESENNVTPIGPERICEVSDPTAENKGGRRSTPAEFHQKMLHFFVGLKQLSREKKQLHLPQWWNRNIFADVTVIKTCFCYQGARVLNLGIIKRNSISFG